MPKTLVRLLKSGQGISTSSKPQRRETSRGVRQEHSRDRESGDQMRKPLAKKSRSDVLLQDGKTGGESEEDRRPLFKRQKGESLKAYLERIDFESNARIMEAYRKTRGKSERRKRYTVCVCSSRTISIHLLLFPTTACT